MRTTSQSLREKALMVPTNEKNILINEAVTLEKEYIAKRVEISNLKSALIYDKFNQNRLMISELISKVKENTDIVNYAYQLSQEAERLMKMGKEMREEANAQFFYSAKYGSISNAEETELCAIGKQVESIQFIEKNNWVDFDRKPFDIYKTNEIEIQFFVTDNKGDDVIHFSICYNEDENKWFSENCIDYPEILFDTYDEMKNHVKTIERDIINNGFKLAKLP
jgi:hypothetical protein